MSSAFLSQAGGTVLAAAETHGRVFFIRVDPQTGKVSEPVSPETKGQHPVVVGNARGEVLLAWAEGTAWAKGGEVAWQTYSANGEPLGPIARVEGVATWGLVSVFADASGEFTLVY